MIKRIEPKKKRKYIKTYYSDKALLYGSQHSFYKDVILKRSKLLTLLKREIRLEFVGTGLSCINVAITKNKRIMFNVHGKWFHPYYSNGVPKCPDRLSGCKEWNDKCIFTVLNDKDIKKFNKVMKKIDKDKLLQSWLRATE